MLTRPGMPPEVVTWADLAALAQFRDDLVALRSQADVVIASHHWGLDHDVLDYQVEIAHTGHEILCLGQPCLELPMKHGEWAQP
jgi:poly-gamma-glutamate synthesis protein (capsule biosynthesis protein)